MQSFPRSTPLLLLALLLCTPESASAQDWTRFRGPNGSGVVEAKNLPVSFGHEENVLWRAEVPYGRSSPVLAGKNIFLTGADESQLITVCINRERGTIRWQRTKERARTEEVYSANDSASPTPATDGTNVYAFFPELGIVSYDATGKERWTHPLGPFVSFYGMSSSPILAGDTLLLACDQQSGSFLLALDAETGETRWRVDRRIVESWSTPVLYPTENPEQVILFGCFAIHAYSIETGEELWTMDGLGYSPVSSPLVQGNRLFVCTPHHAEQPMPDFASMRESLDKDEDGKLSKAEMVGSDFGEHFGWADADKDDQIDAEEWDFISKGMATRDFGLVAIDLTEDGPKEVWRYKKGLPSIATPLIYEGVLYLAKGSGILTTLDIATGEVLHRGRITGTDGEVHPSPVAADGKIFVTSNSGKIAVLQAGGEWEVLGINDLGEDIEATPAMDDGHIYVRTAEGIYCFGASPAD